jgi:hypothetical protein
MWYAILHVLIVTNTVDIAYAYEFFTKKWINCFIRFRWRGSSSSGFTGDTSISTQCSSHFKLYKRLALVVEAGLTW